MACYMKTRMTKVIHQGKRVLRHLHHTDLCVPRLGTPCRAVIGTDHGEMCG